MRSSFASNTGKVLEQSFDLDKIVLQLERLYQSVVD